jgi:5-methylcytosine-specific restriction enzyme subunit McrC
MYPLLYISEQYQNKELGNLSEDLKLVLSDAVDKKPFYHNAEMLCFQLYNEENVFSVDTNYFVGVDWLVAEQVAIYVEPKLNDTDQIDFLGMLMQSLDAPENLEHLGNLFHAEYDQPWIHIPEQKDLLSPILIVQFLKLVQKIVRKGLKKSYYRVTENLNSRIKGKILVGQQIKENIVKNKLTKTICNYQEYGVNTIENQFLKSVLDFVSSYLSQKSQFFPKEQNGELQNILNYCSPSFQQVDLLKNKHQQIYIKQNSFYKEYGEAVKIGGYILKRFSFNINKTNQSQTFTPPFWIDMSKLFELYVFGKLKKLFPEPNTISYHDTFAGGKETDILIREEGYKCVIDCKYKPQYKNDTPSLEDKRQLAGYTRMKSVYDKLAIPFNEIVRGVIIYSHQSFSEEIKKEELLKNEIAEYVEFYKQGIRLPELKAIAFDRRSCSGN